MNLARLLVADRGEGAIRVIRAASEMGIATVAVFADDDARSLHTRAANEALALGGTGAAAYRNGELILNVAKASGCDAIHPGYGVLGGDAAFARRSGESHVIFIGPRPEVLEILADPSAMRRLAKRCGVAIADAAAERATPQVRIEVQTVGDKAGAIGHLWERDCTLQHRGRRLIESAPATSIPESMRMRVISAGVSLAKALRCGNLCAFEFFVDADGSGFALIGARPGLRATHGVTEEATGADLVKAQLSIAAGRSLAELGLDRPPKLRALAIQARVSCDAIDGTHEDSGGGTISALEIPSGPGLRIDTAVYAGYAIRPGLDSLLARVVACAASTDFAEVARKAHRALSELRIDGVATNIALLRDLLGDPDFAANRARVGFVDDRVAAKSAEIPQATETIAESAAEEPVDLDAIRPALKEVQERHALTQDTARPAAVARRRKTGQRTARENVEALCDPGTFVEYGPLVIAAQRRRRALDDLIRNTPADGFIAGIGGINGDLVGPERSRCAVMAYDYTVLAGTQGHQNHRKTDRTIEVAARLRLPLVLFAEGGGGRPGDTDGGFRSRTFHNFPRLSGLVPMVGINSGRCFAGNASLLGCCDVVIAADDSNIGMGGPAMIEGGGLGIFRPEEIGPMEVQIRNGVVDIAVADEAEAVRTARKYLSYFQGPVREWQCADQRLLRSIVPENRLRIYNVRAVVETLADMGSVLELRRGFGLTMVTAFIRIEGRPIGLVANNPAHLAGAIDSDGADKAAHFVRLCDAFDIPLLFLCDTPGIMVGPEIERTALVRHSSRLFLAAANATVPLFTIVLRKAYGLGGIAMAAGAYDAAVLTVAWPTGEFGPMGLEGAVKLGYRKELAAIGDPAQRRKRFDEMVALMYQRGKAVNNASQFSIDDVIDPADSRRWLVAGLRSAPPPAPRAGKKHHYVDSW